MLSFSISRSSLNVADKEDACTNSKRTCSLRTEFFVYLITSEITSAAVSLKIRDCVPLLSTSRVILCGYWHHFLCSFETIPRYPKRLLSARTPLTYPVIAYWSCIVHLNFYRWKYRQNIHYPATYTDLPELRTCNCTSLRRDGSLLLSLSTQPSFRGGYVATILVFIILHFDCQSLSLSRSLWCSEVRKYPVQVQKKIDETCPFTCLAVIVTKAYKHAYTILQLLNTQKMIQRRDK